MTHTFNEQVFLSLKQEDQIKVEHIYMIASLLVEYKQEPLTPKEFDILYDKPLTQLEILTTHLGRKLEE